MFLLERRMLASIQRTCLGRTRAARDNKASIWVSFEGACEGVEMS
jgi:hypothetical protein